MLNLEHELFWHITKFRMILELYFVFCVRVCARVSKMPRTPKSTKTLTRLYSPIYNGSKMFHALYQIAQARYSAIPLMSKRTEMPN
jgi:hypothetical protein